MNPDVVLFVCTGNTCRSPMAAAIFRQMLATEGILGVAILSRGLEAVEAAPMSEGARQALAAAGIPAGSHQAAPLTAQDVERASQILVMTRQHRELLLQKYPEAKTRVALLSEADIPDPLGGSPKDYEKCRIEIQNALLELLPAFKRGL